MTTSAPCSLMLITWRCRDTLHRRGKTEPVMGSLGINFISTIYPHDTKVNMKFQHTQLHYWMTAFLWFMGAWGNLYVKEEGMGVWKSAFRLLLQCRSDQRRNERESQIKFNFKKYENEKESQCNLSNPPRTSDRMIRRQYFETWGQIRDLNYKPPLANINLPHKKIWRLFYITLSNQNIEQLIPHLCGVYNIHYFSCLLDLNLKGVLQFVVSTTTNLIKTYNISATLNS